MVKCDKEKSIMIGIFKKRNFKSVRMKKENFKKFVITDFICPYKKGRNILKPNYTIWVDTIKKSRFRKKDRKIFEPPTNAILKHNKG